jgi:hypothetical protein
MGDIYEVANASAEELAISIHVYGGNIGAMQCCDSDPLTGLKTPFVSGYCTSWMPTPLGLRIRCGKQQAREACRASKIVGVDGIGSRARSVA